jgi:hypothetical protein
LSSISFEFDKFCMQVADTVWVLPGATGGESVSGRGLVPASVIRTSRELQTGLYNPKTLSGGILANGVAGLQFPRALPPSVLAHKQATFPALVASGVLPKSVAERLNAAWLNNVQ